MTMEANHNATSSPLKWTQSLPVKFGLIQVFTACFIILCTFLVLLSIQQEQLLQQQTALNKSNGQVVVAKLQEVTSQVDGLVNSIANLGQLYRYDNQQLASSIPTILNLESQKSLIAGGGIWPEPGAFDKTKHRNSLFWARNTEHKLIQVNDYNSELSSGYHLESWYRPTRFYSRGRTLWSESYMDPHTKTAMVTTSVPMWMDHEFVGAATVDLSLANLSNFLKKALYGTPGYVMALDPYNQLISYPDEKKLFSTNSKGELEFIPFEQFASQYNYYLPILNQLNEADKRFIQQATQQRVFTKEQIDSLQLADNRREMLTAIINNGARGWPQTAQHLFSHQVSLDPLLNEAALVSVFLMPNTYWKIIVVSPLSTLQNQATIIAGKVGTSLLLMQLIALLLLFTIQHRLFIRPISQMVTALKHKSLNKLELDAKERNDEIGILAKAFIYRNEQLEIAMASVDASNLALEQQLEVQQSAQIELQLNKDKLNTLLNSSQCLIYLKDIQGRYTLVNDRFCETIGIERHRLIGSSDREVFSSELTQKLNESERRLLDNEQALYLEEWLPTPHGQECYLFNKFVIKGSEDQITAIGGIAVSIDSKKRQEIEQIKQNQSISAENQYLHKLSEQAQAAADKLKTEHAKLKEQVVRFEQLKQVTEQTHLLVQSILTDLIKDYTLQQDKIVADICLLDNQSRLDKEKFNRHREELVAQAERLRTMSALISKEQGTVKPVNLALFLAQLSAILHPSLNAKEVNLTCHCDERIMVNINTWNLFLFIYTYVNNLLSHAFIGADNRQVSIQASQDDAEHISLIIQDNGIGMPSHQLKQLEALFHQGNCDGRLSQMKIWVEEILQGDFSLESQQGLGTHVLCHIPISPK